MKLIAEYKHWWRMASNWMFALIALLTAVQDNWAAFSEVVPQSWYPYIVITLTVLGIASRLIDQGVQKNATLFR